MANPKISVIIPTCGRPQLLRQAIRSAIDSGSDMEVIVVPNGSDRSWEPIEDEYSADSRVVFSPIAIAHGNSARNHGMRLARGMFLRFLDDDDLLFHGASDLQCTLLIEAAADICSGGVDLVDETGAVFRAWPQPATSDFVESILMPGRVTVPVAHVFRRDALRALSWDESIDLGQDTHWMHSLCRASEWRWVRTDAVVGQWRHHSAPRISSSANISRHLKVSSRILLDSVQSLMRDNRLTPDRRASAVAGLWRMAHSGFFLAPGYWWGIIRTTRRIEPGSRPNISFYRWRMARIIHPLLLESAMTPKRWANHLVRRWRFRRGRLSQVLPP
jgi:glycosyltransferase involved in cell wall biosynthesis